MDNRITKLFTTRSAPVLSIFTTAGYPKFHSTIEVCKSLEEAGVDLIEIGMPYSDPIADGPVIQAVSDVALANGMSIEHLFEQLVELRPRVTVPVLLMGYLNPVMQYGVEQFLHDSASVGIDGFILPDLPMVEFEKSILPLCKELNLSMVFLVTPQTSEERIRKIDEVSCGFIYAVSSPSITGSKLEFAAEQELYFSRLQRMKLRNPIVVGFGISDKESFEAATRSTAGAIIGSAFLRAIKGSLDIDQSIRTFIQKLR